VSSSEIAKFPFCSFLRACLVTTAWIAVCQTFRYFVIVVPMIRATYPDGSDVLPVNIGVLLAWGVWVTIYLLWSASSIWIFLERFGASRKNAIISGSLCTIPTYGLFWLALYLMDFVEPDVIFVALPLAWVELIGVALIIQFRMN